MGGNTTKRVDAKAGEHGPYTLLLVRGADVLRVALPPRGELLIGRDAQADVVLDDDSISRRHARIRGGAPPRIEDLGSTNGTRVMGRTLDAGEVAPLETGMMIELGAVTGLVQHAAITESALPSKRAPAAASLPSGVVVRDPTMTKLYAMIDVIAPSALPVLILGETGVGKDVYAETLHARSSRARGPFVRLNCAALSESLLESELFGHEKGAFTGALAARAGIFESADGGTVFLDEVGELTASTQAKLLRVLENGEVTRLGSTRSKRVDVRFVSATNRDLEALVSAGRFRADLLFRLNGVAVTLPPLRRRPADLTALAAHFATRAAAKMARPALAFSPAAEARIAAHAWPGNVRELRNVIERAVVMAQGTEIGADDLVFGLGGGTGARVDEAAPQPAGVRDEIRALERKRILEALARCDGNQSRAAELLGMPRRTLVARLAEYEIPRPRKP